MVNEDLTWFSDVNMTHKQNTNFQSDKKSSVEKIKQLVSG